MGGVSNIVSNSPAAMVVEEDVVGLAETLECAMHEVIAPVYGDE